MFLPHPELEAGFAFMLSSPFTMTRESPYENILVELREPIANAMN